MISKNTNKNGVKLLATVMVVAVALTGFVLVMDDSSAGGAVENPIVYVGGADASDENGTGAKEKPYATIACALGHKEGNVEVKLLSDVEGAGYSNPSGRNLIIDFGGFTFKMTGPGMAGSTGTQNQVFQLLKGSDVIFRNGKITTDLKDCRMIIQNYGNLTLENMDLDGASTDGITEVLSNNCGEVNICGNTSITARENKCAFDVYWWGLDGGAEPYSEGTQVTLNTTGQIKGNIVIDGNEGSVDSLSALDIKSAIIDGFVHFQSEYGSKVFIGDSVDVEVIVPAGKTVKGTVGFGNNKISFINLESGDSGIKLSRGSIVIGGEISESDSEITVISGTAKLDGDIPGGTTITVSPKATLEIPADYDGQVEGTIVNDGTLSIKAEVQFGQIKNNGTTYLAAGIKDPVTSGNKAVPEGSSGKSFGMSEDLESDYTVVSNAYLEKDLTIPKGITLTVKGTLDLNGNDLIVEGALIIENKGSIINTSSAVVLAGIVLDSTGTISNSGIIGNGYEVEVRGGVGEVSMKNVVGVSFGLTKVASAEYVLTVSGTVSKKGIAYVFEMDGVFIGDFTVKDLENVGIKDSTVIKGATFVVSSKAQVSLTQTQEALTIQKGAVLQIDGSVKPVESADGTSVNVHLVDGATVVVNGVSDRVTYCSNTGEYRTYNGDGIRYNIEESVFDAEHDKTSESAIAIDDLKGIVIEITSKASSDVDGNSWTNQILNLYGTVAFNEDQDEGTLTISGNVTVPSEKELVLKSGMGVVESSDDSAAILNVEGYIGSFVEVGGGDSDVKFVGTMYETKKTVDSVEYPYYNYTTFDKAYALINTVEGKELTVEGGFDFVKNYTIDAGQTINLGDGEYRISKNATVTVKADGNLSGNFVVADATSETIAGIQGILIVEEGASCTPADNSYEVRSKDANGTTTYSGVAVAIENATEGSTIYVTNPVIFTDKTTIPAGVTVEVSDGATITAKKGLVVNGTIENKGRISISADQKLDVNGTVNNESVVAFETASGEQKNIMTVSGKFVGPISGTTAINAAMYTEDGETIYTTVAKAVEACAAMDVPGNVTVTGEVSENSSITLAEGMTLEIKGKVALDSIRVVKASFLKISENGELTADVVGAVGTIETTGAVSDAIVDVSKVTKTVFTMNFNESTSTYTLLVTPAAEFTGTIAFKAGSATIDNADGTTFDLTSTTDTTCAMSIGSDATVVVKNNVTFDVKKTKAFSNNGTLLSKAGMTFIGAKIGGDVTVAVGKNIILEKVSVVGTITLSEEENKDPATATIQRESFIGSAPETLGAAGAISGKVSFADDGYVIVFEGSTFSTTVENVPSTSYVINGVAFATIYGDAKIEAINPVVDKLSDLNTSHKSQTGEVIYDFTWYSGSTKVGSDKYVGSYDTVSAEIGYNSTKVLISTGPGMLVYIDDFQVGTEKKLTIGEHTVTVYIEPDYTGTAVITFNGQTVTNGKISITTDMLGADQTLVITGATPVQPTTPVTPVQPIVTTDDDDMGLTEYLLIVLVILAAILVVVVAIRMMRS